MDWNNPSQAVMKRFFKSGFTAIDIAESLVSFDDDRTARSTREFLKRRDFDVVGVRKNGVTAGYVSADDLRQGPCGQYIQPFSGTLVMEGATPMHLVITALDDLTRVFVTELGTVAGIVTRQDIEKPAARMWLFGVITLIETALGRLIEEYYPKEQWRPLLTEARVEKAVNLQQERRRRHQRVDLIDCLCFADKGRIMSRNPEIRQQFGFVSRNEATKALKNIERLRNNLAHMQDIVDDNWEIIMRFSLNLEQLLDM